MSASSKNTTSQLGEVVPEVEKREQRIATSKLIEAAENNYQPKHGGINNVLLKTGALILISFIMLTSLYILTAGHNLPGGGFIAGLMVSGGAVLMYLCFGKPFASNLRINFRMLMPVGLCFALGTGLGGAVLGYPFLTHTFGHIPIPFFGDWELTSASVFDFGVFLVVIGCCLTIIMNIGENK